MCASCSAFASPSSWTGASGRRISSAIVKWSNSTPRRLEQARGVGLGGAADVLAAELRDRPAARRPLDEPELEQVRLVDVLDRVGLLAERHGKGRQPDRSALELLGDRAEERAVGALEP